MGKEVVIQITKIWEGGTGKSKQSLKRLEETTCTKVTIAKRIQSATPATGFFSPRRITRPFITHPPKMGRDLQKRKNRSSRSKVRQPSSRRSPKLRNPLGNDIVARNWDKKETTTQNYRRLGLVSRLKAPTGGAEPDLVSKNKKISTKPVDPFVIQSTGSDTVFSEVRVERDENGKIVRILGSTSKGRENPLNDPLNEFDTDSEAEEEFPDDGETWGGIEDTRTDVVKQLEEEANRPREKKPRTQSQRERQWLESLVAKYGDNTRAMARDRKLNPMQQTEADISKRLRKLMGEL
ncbi:nucleolar protein 16 [Seiridium cupressi]